MAHRLGRYTIEFNSAPSIIGSAGVVGKNEGEGPLGEEFDYIFPDDTLGETSFEKSESAIQREAIIRAVNKANVPMRDADCVFAGDLLNQCIASTFGLRQFGIPFIGIYGACSNMSLSLGISAVFVDSGASNISVAATSSHFCSAERQFRLPLEYGGQRPPTAQRTVTAAGATVVGKHKSDCPSINAVTFGKITDLGIKDANNMGAAMAPAASHTISDFFEDTGLKPSDIDYIVTGDLGFVGSELLIDLLKKDHNIDISANHLDCGKMMYYRKEQDVHAGGSGCGCCASILNTYFLNRIKKGEIKRILVTATGALMSPTSTQQGETIPSIAHSVLISMPDNIN